MTDRDQDSDKRSRQTRRSSGSRSLGSRIRKFRNKLGLTQEVTAHRVGRSEHWLLLVENGRADPGYTDLVKLAMVFNVELVKLLDDVDELPTPSQSAGSGAPLVDTERLSRIWQRPSAIDNLYLDQLEELIRWYWQRYHVTGPALLLPAVSSHVVQLWPLADESLPEATSRRLRSLVGQASALTGWLYLRLSNRTTTGMYWALAEALATEAKDHALRGFTLASRSSLYTSTLRGGHGGDAMLALAFLNASMDVGSEAAAVQRAWTLSRRAEEHALRGDDHAAGSDLEGAARYLAQVHGKTEGYFEAWDEAQLAGYRGSCAQALGSPDAVTLLEGSLAATDPSLISQRTAILTNLGAAHAQHSQVDEACAALTEAVMIAGRTSLAVAVERVRGVRERLRPWSDAPSVRRLDELMGSLT